MDPIYRRCRSEARRICAASPRIQKSGDVGRWEDDLTQIRWRQIQNLNRFLPSQQLKFLNSRLKDKIPSYQFSPEALADFLQSFYMECLRVFRREFGLESYSPKSRLENAEFFAFCDRYSKRKIRGDTIVRLRARDFLQSRPKDIPCEIEAAAEYSEESSAWGGAIHRAYLGAAQEKEREKLAAGDRRELIAELFQFLEAKGKGECVPYLRLVAHGFSARAIDEALGLTMRERDYLQQKAHYWILKFQGKKAGRHKKRE
jgi:hypothetical protein